MRIDFGTGRLGRRWLCVSIVASLLAIVVATSGCADRQVPVERSADQVLKEMLAAYQQAAGYSDAAQLFATYQIGDKLLNHQFESSHLAVALARPNKVRVQAYGVTLVSDGQRLRGAIADVPNQVLDVAAPTSLTLDNLLADEVVSQDVLAGAGPAPIQLALLLGSDGLKPILDDAERPQLLEADTIDNQPCDRVEVRRAEGALVFWIDQQTRILRRLEVPTRSFAHGLRQNAAVMARIKQDFGADAQLSDVRLWIEFARARFSPPDETTAFQFEVPAGARLVAKFEAATFQVPTTEVAAKSEPRAFRLTPLWSQTELQQPGNILVVPRRDQPPRILVVERFKSLVELDPQGKIGQRAPLGLADDAVVSFVRATTDREGKTHFLAAASGMKQVHVLDDQLRKLWSYPEGEAAEVADAQWGDLDADGQPEMNVAFWGVVGVHGVSLAGKPLWRHSLSLENVYRLAVAGADGQGRRNVLACHGPGAVATIAYGGERTGDKVVENRRLAAVFAQDLDGDGQPELCGLAIGAATGGGPTLVGLDRELRESWSYLLPGGEHATKIEMLTAGPLRGSQAAEWIAAGADGSLHILAADGKPIDRWNHGAPLTGMAVATIDGKPTLIVSTAKSVEAWTIALR